MSLRATSSKHGRTGRKVRHHHTHKSTHVRRHRFAPTPRTGHKARRGILRMGHVSRALKRKSSRHAAVRKKRKYSRLTKTHRTHHKLRKVSRRRRALVHKRLHHKKPVKRRTKRRHDRRRSHHKKR